MAFNIGENCEGLHEGRWFVCTILSLEEDGYKVTFENWSSRYDTVLQADCIRARSPSMAHGRKRKRLPLVVNFSKLFPEDELYVQVDGTRKLAIVKIIDPFLELLTVVIDGEEKTVSFQSVIQPDVFATPVPVKKKKQVPFSKQPASPATPAPPSAYIALDSTVPQQFVSVMRPDGLEISCGDLVTFSATSTDLAFLVVEIYQRACQQNPHEMLKAQKCEISENTVVKLTEDFNVTCPVACAHKLNTKISSSVAKAVQEVKKKAIVRCAESLNQYAEDRGYQLRARRHDLAAKIRGEIKKTMTTKAARSCSLKIGAADLSKDLEVLSLTLENGFKVSKSKHNLDDLDFLLGKEWDVKIKPDNHFFYVTYAEFALDISTRTLVMKVKFAESTCSFRAESYRSDTASDCC